MSCKFVEYQIARYGVYENGPSSSVEDRITVEDDLGTGCLVTDFWALEGVLPSDTFELEEVCRGSFDHCVEIYRRITGFNGPLVEPKHNEEYAIERLFA